MVDDEVQGEADGTWRYVIDTTSLEPGLYSVRSSCVPAEGQGFDYGPGGFVVVGGVVPPVEPVPGTPSFTG